MQSIPTKRTRTASSDKEHFRSSILHPEYTEKWGTTLLFYFPYNTHYKLTSNLPLNDVGLEGSHVLPLLEGAVRLVPAVHKHDVVLLEVRRGVDCGRIQTVPNIGLFADLDPVHEESLHMLVVVVVASLHSFRKVWALNI